MKYTQAPVGIAHDDKLNQTGDQDRMDELPSLDAPPAQSGPSRPPPYQKRQKPQEEGAKQGGGKKYVNMRLIDFGCRSRGSSADGGKAKIRGDAFLSLLLFESDTCDVVTKEDGTKEKVYRGGSKGAFERISKLKEGAVIALLNPKILKPFQVRLFEPYVRNYRWHLMACSSVPRTNHIRQRTSSHSPRSRTRPSQSSATQRTWACARR